MFAYDLKVRKHEIFKGTHISSSDENDEKDSDEDEDSETEEDIEIDPNLHQPQGIVKSNTPKS